MKTVTLLEEERITNKVSYSIDLDTMDTKERDRLIDLLNVENPDVSQLNELLLLLSENADDIKSECIDSNDLTALKILNK